jgi:hypothetical protein
MQPVGAIELFELANELICEKHPSGDVILSLLSGANESD